MDVRHPFTGGRKRAREKGPYDGKHKDVSSCAADLAVYCSYEKERERERKKGKEGERERRREVKREGGGERGIRVKEENPPCPSPFTLVHLVLNPDLCSVYVSS